MKDKRNCQSTMNYPIYQQPYVVPPMGYPIGVQGMNNNYELSNIEQQINILDQRVTRLEKLNSNTYNKYNDSNYYMV